MRSPSTARSCIFALAAAAVLWMPPAVGRGDTGSFAAHVWDVTGDYVLEKPGAAPRITQGMELHVGDVITIDPRHVGAVPASAKLTLKYVAPLTRSDQPARRNAATAQSCRPGPGSTKAIDPSFCYLHGSFTYTVEDVGGGPTGWLETLETLAIQFKVPALHGAPSSTLGVVQEQIADGVAEIDGDAIALTGLTTEVDPDTYIASIVPVADDGTADPARAARHTLQLSDDAVPPIVRAALAPGVYALTLARGAEPQRALGRAAWVLLAPPSAFQRDASAYAHAVATAGSAVPDPDARRDALVYTRAMLLALAHAPAAP